MRINFCDFREFLSISWKLLENCQFAKFSKFNACKNLKFLNPGNQDSFQAWILAPDIGQCPGKNLIMSNESWFTMKTAVRREVKRKLSYRGLKTYKHSVSIALSCSGFSFYEHFNTQLYLLSFLYLKP